MILLSEMNIIFARTALLFLPYLPILNTENYKLRIYGGIDDKTSMYPYVVALKGSLVSVSKSCTGSLITETWVLSAAHCLSPKIKFIQYGDMAKLLIFTDTKSAVLKVIPHPRYIELHRNDIGLLLVSPVNMKSLGRISAVDYRTLVGASVEYAGYGMSFVLSPKKGRDRKNEILLDATRPLRIGKAVVSSCEDSVSKSFICLSSNCSDKQFSLYGDSGGPLFYDKKIVGVVHGVTFHKDEAVYHVFTPVSPFLPWIRSVMFTTQIS